MPLYLWRATYTAEGTKGLLKDGGSKRREVVEQMVTKAGGKLHAFYFAMGKADLYIIVELPDLATAVSLSLAVSASGSANIRTIVLVTPEEMDSATKKSVTYRAPGT